MEIYKKGWCDNNASIFIIREPIPRMVGGVNVFYYLNIFNNSFLSFKDKEGLLITGIYFEHHGISGLVSEKRFISSLSLNKRPITTNLEAEHEKSEAIELGLYGHDFL